MKNDSGKFICPKCKNNGMFGYPKWISKISFKNNSPVKVWIFYGKIKNEIEKQKCKFTSLKYFCLPWSIAKKITTEHNCNDISICFCYLITFSLSIYYFIFYLAAYIVVLMWIDIFSYCCCKKYFCQYYCLFLNYDNNEFEIKTINNIDNKSKIWDYCRGTEEKDFLKYGKRFFTCNKCNWQEKSFLNFIPKFAKVNIIYNVPSIPNASEIYINTTSSNELTQETETKISLIFMMNVPAIHCSVVCSLNETFESVLQKLYKDYPDLKKKKIYFISGGNSFSETSKTIRELKLKNSDIVQIEQIADNFSENS